ncbi:MAG TPA: Ig-like domain-containing protein, partial [Solirubrobacteraceae bacterium]|nr:Ig-like domain-containing protein [Solirubrobacteraceae bacterium]
MSLVVVAVGPVAIATAEKPSLTIQSPPNGRASNNQTPSFSGITDDLLDEVTLNIYAGTGVAAGAPLQALTTPLVPASGTWAVGPAETLRDGTYTAQAVQTNLAMESGASEPVTFTVDTESPTVTLAAPKSPSNNTTPSFTGTASETTPVTVR